MQQQRQPGPTNHDAPAGVNLDELQELFRVAQEKTAALDGQEVVLVIGNSGTGKSTCINYMLEYPLEMVRNVRNGGRELRLLNPDAPGAAPIGRLLGGSETLFPAAYMRADVNPLIFCDTGGFPDTRGGSTTIAIHYAIRSVVTTARRIKAIIIMCTEAQLFDADKGASIVAAKIKAVKELLGPDLAGYQNSVFLIFNKVRDRDLEQLRNTLSDVAAGFSVSRNASEREIADLLSFIKLENILIIHPADQGESRPLITENLMRSPGVGGNYKQHVANSFDGGPHYGHLKNISELIAGRFLGIHQRTTMHSNREISLKGEIQALNADIASDQASIQTHSVPQNADVALAAVATSRQTADTRKTNIIADIDRLTARDPVLREEIRVLENDRTEIFAGETEKYDEHEKYGVVLIGTIHRNPYLFSAEPGLPIHRFEEGGRLGTQPQGTAAFFQNRIDNRDRYQSEYVGPSHYYGWAQVKFYSLQCETQANKTQITTKQAELNSNAAVLPTKRVDLTTVNKKLDGLEATRQKIVADLNNAIAASAAIVANCRANITRNQSVLPTKKTQLTECQAELRAANEELERYQPDFRMLRRLCGIFVSLRREPIIDEFMTKTDHPTYRNFQGAFFQAGAGAGGGAMPPRPPNP